MNYRITATKYKHGTNDRLDQMLTYFPDCILFIVQGPRGRRPVAVEKTHPNPKKEALRQYTAGV